MNNLSLNFFGEIVNIKIPETLANLRQQISEKFLFSPSETAEILISYGKDLGKKLIETEKDFEDFVKKKIFKIDLDVDPKSQIFQESLLKLKTESEENKKKLEEILKEIEEIKKQKKAKKEDAKIVLDEFTKNVKELEKKKKDIIAQLDKEIKEKTIEINNIKKNSEQDIKSLDSKEKELDKVANSLKEKLGIPVEKKPKLKSKAKPKGKSKEKAKDKSKEKPKEKKTVQQQNQFNLMENIKNFGNFMLLNSEQIANNIFDKYNFFKNYFTQQQQQKEAIEIHYDYICDGCEISPIMGTRYHCEQCEDYDLCEKCYASEKKTAHGHSFKAIKGETIPLMKYIIPKTIDKNIKNIHFGVSCDGCGTFPLVGVRYKCGVCPNFDFCENCEKKEALKHGHPLIRLPYINMLRGIKCNMKDSPKKNLEKDEKVIFENINCNGCGAKSIEGIRYKCVICKNFDYCEKCFKENCEKHNHPFLKLYHQYMQLESIKTIINANNNKQSENKEKEQETKNENVKPIHYGVICDGCKKNPIVGCRYKCAVCKNFDYCEECEEKFNKTHQHPFIKIYKPQMRLGKIQFSFDEKSSDDKNKK